MAGLLNLGVSVFILITQWLGRGKVPGWVTIPALILVVTSSAVNLMARDEEIGPDEKSRLQLIPITNPVSSAEADSGSVDV